jgi:uncharacterized protein
MAHLTGANVPENTHRILSPALIRMIRRRYQLAWRGLHGAGHWARVRHNGLQLAAETGASLRVVEAFAFLHDSCRLDEGCDPGHGARAAAFIRTLPSEVLPLDASEREFLEEACIGHSDGLTRAPVTVQTCWDADRLDLTRLAIWPDPDRMCTEAGRQRAMDLLWGPSVP